MGMTAGWLSKDSAENFIIEQHEAFDDVFYDCPVQAISIIKCKFTDTRQVFCIAVMFDGDTKHLLTEADVRLMTGEQRYEI